MTNVVSVPPEFDTVAAVDLGSNSFHMVVARLVRSELHIVDRLRERVALAGGLDERKRLTSDAQERALACIERFGERLRGMPQGSVRAVGTSALRMARNQQSFVARAEEALGHPIEIVSGAEEARLIYLGVAHDLSDDSNRRLVIDIGGGSTECILGQRFEALKTDSLHMGCVNYSLRFFPSGAITKESMEKALLAARLEVRGMERSYRGLGWEDCIGASGTILAVETILSQNQWSERGITPKGLRKLRKALVEAGHAEKLALPGLQPERAPVLAGGVAILSALFDGLEIEMMQTSNGALREGVLYDLAGRIRHEDLRELTIRRLSHVYHVDLEQAQRVERTALALFEQVAKDWDLPIEQGAQFLAWAARLHEIGISLSHNGYHKHGAYLVDHSDMPGFSRTDQLMLAALIEGHRRKLSTERFEALPISLQRPVMRLCVLLRLAVLLNRSRSQLPLPAVQLAVKKSAYLVSFPPEWLEGNPLTRADIEEEAERLTPLSFEVTVA
jgi:exopolyphosphatase/guanosine-5'-triphosphate,3'-diphosphate pyrophosphatase